MGRIGFGSGRPLQGLPRPGCSPSYEARREIQHLQDPGVQDPRDRVRLLDEFTGLCSEQIQRAPVRGYNGAADVADTLALPLQPDAYRCDRTLIKPQLVQRDGAQVALDKIEGHRNASVRRTPTDYALLARSSFALARSNRSVVASVGKETKAASTSTWSGIASSATTKPASRTL